MESPAIGCNSLLLNTLLSIGVVLLGVLTWIEFPSGFGSFSLSLISAHSRRGSYSSLDLKLQIANEYSYQNLSTFDYPFLKEALLFEPYKQTKVTVSGLSANAGCIVSWSLSLVSNSTTLQSGNLENNTFSLTPSTVGLHSLEITEKCGDIGDRNYISPVWIKYVRRELLSLTESDREEFLDALSTLWLIDTVTGQELYGENYKSLQYFATIHNDAGGNSVCDEFHSNSGFINNHIYLGAYLEQSLQLVNPRVALHYMEYTKVSKLSSTDFSLLD